MTLFESCARGILVLGGGSQDSLWLGEVQRYKATWNRVVSGEVQKTLFGSEEVHRYKAASKGVGSGGRYTRLSLRT